LTTGGNVKFSLKAIILAAALLKGISFLFVALMNFILPPYGGAFLALMTSLYPGYDPTTGPISIVIGALYAVIAGGAAGAVFGWIYNLLAPG
jgi:hypothetical protein